MKFSEATRLVAYRTRWRALIGASFFPLPLLIIVFRSWSLDGWTVLRVISYALLLMIWIGALGWLASPIRNWRMLKVSLLAASGLLFGWMVFHLTRLGVADVPRPHVLLLVACIGALTLVGAFRVRAPSEEDIRFARTADDYSGGHVSWWIKLLALALGVMLAAFVLVSLYRIATGT